MSNLEQFQAYAAAFEETYADDDWQRLEKYFTDDAVYAPGDGTEVTGRDQVLAQLRGGINGLDRRFDSRELSAAQPSSQGDMVSLSWQLRLSKTGAPDITATGVEHAKYTDGAISRLEDVFDEGIAEGLGEWMAAHGDSLDG
jgi:ketosteroid isomerase-like protein